MNIDFLSNKTLPFYVVKETDSYAVFNVLRDMVFNFNQKQASQHKNEYIKNYGWHIYNFIASKGFVSVENKNVKGNSDVSLASELSNLMQELKPPAIYVINNLTQYLPEDKRTLARIYDTIRMLDRICIEKSKKIIIIGSIEMLPKDIQELFVELDLSEEINHTKETYLKALNLSNNLKNFSLMAITNINHLLEEGLNMEDAINQFNGTQILELLKSEIDFTSIGGLDEIKEYFKRYKVLSVRQKVLKLPQNFLFVGKSGCGKTMMAKALAKELNLPLYRVDMGKIYNLYLGATEENIRRLWNEIKQTQPAIILFDEIEKMLAGIESSSQSDAGTTARILSYMLYELQEHSTSSIIVGTVNNLKTLPEEFFRLERWDKIFELQPNEDYSLAVFSLYLNKYASKKLTVDDKIKLSPLIKDKCGAEIKNIIESAVFNLLAGNKKLTKENIIKEILNGKY